MERSVAKTYGSQLREIVGAYREAGEPWPATARQIAAWAYNTGRWQPKAGNVIKQCAEDISRALREEYYTDPQGRSVRTKHAALVKQGDRQLMMWDDIRSAEPEHMQRSVQLRRQQIVGDCCQLKRDCDSYSDNNPHGAQLLLNLNFEKDVVEADAAQEPSSSARPSQPR